VLGISEADGVTLAASFLVLFFFFDPTAADSTTAATADGT